MENGEAGDRANEGKRNEKHESMRNDMFSILYATVNDEEYNKVHLSCHVFCMECLGSFDSVESDERTVSPKNNVWYDERNKKL